MIKKQTSLLPKFASEVAARMSQLQADITHLQAFAASEVARNRHKRANMTATEREQMRLELFGAYDGVAEVIDTNLWLPDESHLNQTVSAALEFPELSVPDTDFEVSVPGAEQYSQPQDLPPHSHLTLPQVKFDFPTYTGLSEGLLQTITGMDVPTLNLPQVEEPTLNIPQINALEVHDEVAVTEPQLSEADYHAYDVSEQQTFVSEQLSPNIPTPPELQAVIVPSTSEYPVDLTSPNIPQFNLEVPPELQAVIVPSAPEYPVDLTSPNIPQFNLEVPPELQAVFVASTSEDPVDLTSPDIPQFNPETPQKEEVEASILHIPVSEVSRPQIEQDKIHFSEEQKPDFGDVAEYIEPQILDRIEQKVDGTYEPEPEAMIAFKIPPFPQVISSETRGYFTYKTSQKNRPKISFAQRLSNLTDSLKKILEEEQHHV